MEEMAASIQTVAGSAQGLAAYVEETSSSITEMGASIEEVARSGGTLSENLTEIEDALAKLEAGTYGQCESCQQTISAARLEAVPAARYCINCASARR